MSDAPSHDYEKPALERYGDFRELTRLTGMGMCYGQDDWTGLCKDHPEDGRS